MADVHSGVRNQSKASKEKKKKKNSRGVMAVAKCGSHLVIDMISLPKNKCFTAIQQDKLYLSHITQPKMQVKCTDRTVMFRDMKYIN